MRYLLPTVRPIAEDLAGTLVFYLVFLVTGSAWTGAVIGFAIGVAQIVALRIARRPVPALLLTGVALTATLGGLTLVTHDPRFILFKPSIIYAAIAVTMLPRGWVARYAPAEAVALLPMRTFDRVGWAWAALMAATAALNAALVLTLPPHRAALLFLIMASVAKIALFAVQYAVLKARARRLHVALQATPATRSVTSANGSLTASDGAGSDR